MSHRCHGAHPGSSNPASPPSFFLLTPPRRHLRGARLCSRRHPPRTQPGKGRPIIAPSSETSNPSEKMRAGKLSILAAAVVLLGGTNLAIAGATPRVQWQRASSISKSFAGSTPTMMSATCPAAARQRKAQPEASSLPHKRAISAVAVTGATACVDVTHSVGAMGMDQRALIFCLWYPNDPRCRPSGQAAPAHGPPR
jgi:hypothetical protein